MGALGSIFIAEKKVVGAVSLGGGLQYVHLANNDRHANSHRKTNVLTFSD